MSLADLDGIDAATLATRASAETVVLLDATPSTMDEAHARAQAGAPDGTVVIAARQTSGRGRLGRSWTSESGLGLWMTVIARGVPASGLDVLSLRIGLEIAPVLDVSAGSAVGLKWPNDVMVGRKKLAGILVEARWRDATPEWVAVGVGVNIIPPADQPNAAGLRGGTTRAALAVALVPAIRSACRLTGQLSAAEMASFASRDVMAGAAVVQPVAGRARGIDHTGAMVIETEAGLEHFRRGSLALRGDGE